MKLKQALYSGLVWSAIDKVVSQGGYFLLILYLARHLEPADFGLVGMLAIFSVLADTLVNGGFFHALVRQGKQLSDSDCSTVFILSLLIAAFLYLVLFSMSGLIAEFYGVSELSLLSKILFLGVIINSLAIVPKALLTIKVDFRSQAKANVTSMLFSAIVAVVAVTQDAGFWAILAMMLTRWSGNTLFIWYFSKWIPSLKFSVDSLKRLWSFGYKLVIAGVVSTLGNNIYSLVIGKTYGATQTGYFTQSKSFTELLAGNIALIIQGVTFPVLANTNGNQDLLQSFYEKTIRATVFVTFPILVGFASVSEEFVLLFLGDNWLPIVPLIVYMSFARIFIPVSALNTNGLNILGKSGLYLVTDLLKLPLTFVILFLTLPYGVEAVTKGQLAVAVVSYLINTYYPSKYFRYRTIHQIRDMIPVIIICTVMWFGVDFITVQSDIVRLLGKVLMGISVYVMLSYLFNRNALNELIVFARRG